MVGKKVKPKTDLNLTCALSKKVWWLQRMPSVNVHDSLRSRYSDKARELRLATEVDTNTYIDIEKKLRTYNFHRGSIYISRLKTARTVVVFALAFSFLNMIGL